jgi:subtilisin family serine protease
VTAHRNRDPKLGNRNPNLVAKVQGQAARIADAFRTYDGTIIETELDPDGGIAFMYAQGQLLVRDEYLERVQVILGQPPDRRNVSRVIEGVVLLTLEPADKNRDLKVADGVRPPVLAAVEAVDDDLGVGVATLDQVLTVAPSGPCPATEPQEVYDDIEPYPGICTENSGEGALVYIADTGLLKDYALEHPWLDERVRRGDDPDGNIQPWELELQPDPVAGVPTIPPYAGHGTFVAGVVRCMAPESELIVANIFKVAGSSLEHHLAKQLRHALRLGVDIFHLSIATPTRNSLPLIAFERWLRLVDQFKGVVCVVAAGNDGSQRPCWPAAFPQTVSVGALAANWRDRADFSNYGGWVDVYAPGRDLINAYARGPYRCRDDPYPDQIRNFYGMCRWSGTSFSTPIVTGLIAARMWRTGESGQEAAAALLAEARSQAIPGVGAILLPCGGKGYVDPT